MSVPIPPIKANTTLGILTFSTLLHVAGMAGIIHSPQFGLLISMCASAFSLLWAVFWAVPSATAADPSNSSSHFGMGTDRIILTLDVEAFHGSSAMEVLLISSPQVASLCRMSFEGKMVWQCEPQKVLVDPESLEIVGVGKRKANFKHLEPLRRLEFMGKHWNLRNPILFCKFCGLDIPSISKPSWLSGGPQSLTTLPTLPKNWQAANISSLTLRIIIMWRPLCMHRLSSHSKAVDGNSYNQTRSYLLKEIGLLENTLARREQYSREYPDVKYLVVGLDELTWKLDVLRQRLLAFVPGLERFTKRPVHRGFKSKDGFGEENPPWSCCGFDVEQRECCFHESEYRTLTAVELQRAQAVMKKLVALGN